MKDIETLARLKPAGTVQFDRKSLPEKVLFENYWKKQDCTIISQDIYFEIDY